MNKRCKESSMLKYNELINVVLTERMKRARKKKRCVSYNAESEIHTIHLRWSITTTLLLHSNLTPLLNPSHLPPQLILRPLTLILTSPNSQFAQTLSLPLSSQPFFTNTCNPLCSTLTSKRTFSELHS